LADSGEVEEYDVSEFVGKYCAVLFALPKWQYLTITLIAVSALLVVFMREESPPLLVNAAVLYALLELYAKTSGAKTVFYKFKRRIGLSLATLVYSTFILALTRESSVSVASSVALVATIVLGLDGVGTQKYLLAVAPPVITLSALRLLGYQATRDFIAGLLVAFSLVLVDLVLRTIVSKWRVNEYSYLELGMLFFKNWLDRKTEIEPVFEELGVYQYVNPRIVELGNLALIYTDVHYGPFSNVGSSRLPELLSRAFKKLGVKNVVALHGLGSHDRNIASAKYVYEYLENLVKAYLGNGKTKLLYHGAFLAEDGEWRVLGLVFDKLSILVVSRPGKGIDDLPYSIQLDYEVKARREGLGDVVIVDAHNWELQEIPNLRRLRAILDKSLGEIARLKSRSPVEVYYNYKCFEARVPGVIGDEGCVLCIAGEGKEKVCIACLRGNNMEPGVRDTIIRELEPLGADYVEALTNDEHSETGVRPYVAYTPVGESPELVEALRKVVLSLKDAGYQESAWLYTCRMDLKLMGESINRIKREMVFVGKALAVAYSTYVFAASPLVSLLVHLLLNSL